MGAGSNDLRQVTTVLKALAEETRLEMVMLLSEFGELCVCDLEHALAITQSKASRHLRYLLNAGLVEDRREGVWMHYRLVDDLDPWVGEIIKCLRGAMDPGVFSAARERLVAWLATEGKSTPGARCCGPEPESKLEVES